MSQPAWATEAERRQAKVAEIVAGLRAGADRLSRARVDAGLAAEWGEVMREVAGWLADIAGDVRDGRADSAGTNEERLVEQRARLISARDAALAAIDFRDPIVVCMTVAVSWIGWAITRLHGARPDLGID